MSLFSWLIIFRHRETDPNYFQVVPMNSAILPAYTSIGIHNNHMGMTKFEAEDDPGFKSVAGELQRWVKELKPMSGK